MKFKTRKTSDFFLSEYANWASYDNLRKIGSLVDGQKNAARKILWFTLTKNLKSEIKVSQLDSKVAEETEYLHGSMAGVIVNLAKDYIGTNNINLLFPEGNFGTRLVPEASAPRYIYTHGTSDFFEIFSKSDNEILEHQNFEGKTIEPKFLLPKLPMLLINGSEGVTPGFKQLILPRNPKEIEKYITYYLKNPDAVKKPFKNKPFFRGFKGRIQQGETNKQWEIYGLCEKINRTTVVISELPIGYNLKSYRKILDRLEDDKKIISYSENCIEDFHFEIKFSRSFLDDLTDEKLIDLLKLKKTISENYVVITEKNTIRVFNDINEILWEYIRIKKEFLEKRKSHEIQTITDDIRLLISKYIFIKAIVDETLQITKRPTQDIIKDLDNINKIIKIENSYDYLLNMPVRSLTEERMKKLIQKIKEQKSELDLLKSQTKEQIWLKDLKG